MCQSLLTQNNCNVMQTTVIPSVIRVLTWNVWISPYEFVESCERIFALIKHHSPDVVCFQEVICDFISKLYIQT